MAEDLVEIYESATLAEAQLLVSRLDEAGIEAFIDNTDSPLDGLTAADQYNIVRVLPRDATRAKQIAAEFLAESMKDADFGELGEDD